MVFDESVGARKEKALVTIVVPLHAIRRPALVAFDRQDQSRTVTLADMVAANDQPITLCCMHRISYPSLRLSKSASSNSSGRFRFESPELSSSRCELDRPHVASRAESGGKGTKGLINRRVHAVQ